MEYLVVWDELSSDVVRGKILVNLLMAHTVEIKCRIGFVFDFGD
jgi:hypothetical protein